MSLAYTQGNSILVDDPDSASAQKARMVQPGAELVSWVADRTRKWEQHRNQGYQAKWAEYWRMWRGQWADEDRNRLSERSRLIAPALSQAIEMTVSEIDEGLFSRDVWLDITDDIKDEDKVDALIVRDQLLEDFDCAGVKDACSEAVLNAAIFGTGIVKINTTVTKAKSLYRDERTGSAAAKERDQVVVAVESIRPDEFIPDPAGRTIAEMLGCAHRVSRPKHVVLERIEQGTYRKDALDTISGVKRPDNPDIDRQDPQSSTTPEASELVDIVEYHGKVPLRMLTAVMEKTTALDDVLAAEPDTGANGALVEAIVTIANGTVLLRAMVNPFVMTDRSIIAFQFEKVPGRFWGRGVAEKGYNPQKALDAEIRARIDALGFISSPMLGVDSGRVPRGFKLEVKPGKVWLTQGNPSEVLQPITLGDLNPATFNQAQEMERMVQMGTGAFDTASALNSQSQSGANGASSNSMMMGAYVKRAKRAIANVDRNLVVPMVEKAVWRYMQFDPERYPRDYKFRARATMGIIARELQSVQLTQLMAMLPEQFPGVSLAVAQGIIENSAVNNKLEITKAVNAALQPPPPEEQEKAKKMQEVLYEAELGKAQGVLLENQLTIAQIRKTLADAQLSIRKADVADDQILQEQQRIGLQQQEVAAFAEQNQIAFKRLELQEKQLKIKQSEAAKK
jgi:hypothetical protein